MALPVLAADAAAEAIASAEPHVLLWRAAWCAPCFPLGCELAAMATEWPAVKFAAIDAEACGDLAASHAVETVPLVFLTRGGTILARVSGATPRAIRAALTAHFGAATGTPMPLAAKVAALAACFPLVLFIVGSPSAPQCRFTRALVDLLGREGWGDGSFAWCDVNGDDALIEAVKAHASWPTFPQVYAKGELVGGADIVTQLAADGQLRASLGEPVLP